MLQESEVRRTFSKVDKQRRGYIDNADDFELLVLALGHNATAKVRSFAQTHPMPPLMSLINVMAKVSLES